VPLNEATARPAAARGGPAQLILPVLFFLGRGFHYRPAAQRAPPKPHGPGPRGLRAHAVSTVIIFWGGAFTITITGRARHFANEDTAEMKPAGEGAYSPKQGRQPLAGRQKALVVYLRSYGGTRRGGGAYIKQGGGSYNRQGTCAASPLRLRLPGPAA
jgi:hypothetical protein